MAIAPHERAIKRSKIVGVVLEIICDVKEEKGIARVTNPATKIETTILKNKLFKDLIYIILCPLFTAKAND